MAFQSLLYDTDSSGVATITMNRPGVRNAFNTEMIAELTAAFTQANSDDEINVIQLDAAGEHFSAGADLNWMKSMAGMNFAENVADANNLATLMHTIDQSTKPTIACVNGAAFGGALGLIACCDIAIAGLDAKFCLSEVKLGLVPAVISPYVIRAIGQRNANRYFLTAETFDARTAVDMGLIHQATETSELHSTTKRIINQLLCNGPNAVKTAKALIRQVSSSDLDDTLMQFTAELIARVRVSEEGQEGLAAFLEKRKPTWNK